MRLMAVETPLRLAVHHYIKEVYSYVFYVFPERAEPDVRVYDSREFDKKYGLTTNACYDILQNRLCFRGRPIPRTVAHEVEHWAQVSTYAGGNVYTYIDQLRDVKTMLQHEKSADDVSLANAHKLRW